MATKVVDKKAAFAWMCGCPDGFSTIILAKEIGVTRRWANQLLTNFAKLGAVKRFCVPGQGGRHWWEVVDPTVDVGQSYRNGYHPNQIKSLAKANAKRSGKVEEKAKEVTPEHWPSKPYLCHWIGVPEAIAYAEEATKYDYGLG